MELTPNFTLDELLTYLESPKQSAEDGYYTMREWAEKLNISSTRMRKLLVEAHSKGLLRSRRGNKLSIDDAVRSVPVYYIVSSK